jgi:anti-sigma B factor antagonist
MAYCYNVDGTYWLDPKDHGRVSNDWGTEYSIREVSPGSPRPAPPTLRDLRARPIRGGSQELALECSLSETQGSTVVVVSGEVDLATISLLRDALSQAVEKRRSVILDISRLQYIDSTGLSELLSQHRRAQTQKQHFVLAGPSRLLSKLLQITHLSEAIPMYPSVATALASCRRPPESHGAALANDRV